MNQNNMHVIPEQPKGQSTSKSWQEEEWAKEDRERAKSYRQGRDSENNMYGE